MRHPAPKAAIAAALSLALAGCSSLPLPRSAGPAPDARAQLTRAALQEQGHPVMYVALPAMGTSALLAPSGRNGDVTTWSQANTVSLSFEAGILTATRGLGADMMSAELSGTRAMMNGASPERGYPRHIGYLDGEYRQRFRGYLCKPGTRAGETITIMDQPHRVTRIEERCTSPEGGFTNVYWRGANGTTWKSRQWISPEIGYLETELLVR
ncbi:YjbF family lipoprotein [Rhodovulum adriaticum]|uniref:Group 4 capsule polysaccharide lipoprotein GfcB/YjbF n=1 Tax=Rhodovulum adriaticum TaxID=35804 RepID=A0A4R2NYM2_RHOAD|nr:YjbF family lipoprotein [Rhodovulum adriaticum]MBK1634121.1 hypothetical protein [Rhodovulum adriaticum]TCP27330.1 group 4 capsule polysaccharide lipoprotein GfcB/YjbF [Rhodovulum adriaticum]